MAPEVLTSSPWWSLSFPWTRSSRTAWWTGVALVRRSDPPSGSRCSGRTCRWSYWWYGASPGWRSMLKEGNEMCYLSKIVKNRSENCVKHLCNHCETNHLKAFFGFSSVLQFTATSMRRLHGFQKAFCFIIMHICFIKV